MSGRSGCKIIMVGGDSRGCVANMLGDSIVYFRQGDQCPRRRPSTPAAPAT